MPISVVIPAYNRAELLVRALGSVAAQVPLLPAEVVVVDDASTDDTATVAERWGARVVRLTENRGAAGARNAGFAAATQPWIALLDSDDEWLPHCLEVLWNLRGDHVLAAGSHVSTRDGEQHHRYQGPVLKEPYVLNSPAQLVFPGNFLVNSATLVKRDTVLEVGGYDTALRFSEDFDLWLRVLDKGTGIATRRVVVRYHQHAGQKTQDVFPLLDAQEQITRAYRDRPWWSPGLAEGRKAVRTWDEIRLGRRAGTRWDHARRWGWLLARPSRSRALLRALLERMLRRRQASRIDDHGEPRVAIFPGSAEHRERAAALARGHSPWDLHHLGRVRAAGALLRRPAGRVYVQTRTEAILLRALALKAIRSRAVAGGLHPPGEN